MDYYTDKTICQGEKLYLPEHGGIFYINSAQLDDGIFESSIFGAGEYTLTWKKEGFADATFKVNNSYGNVDVITWSENRIEIEVHISTSSNNEEKAQKKLDQITVEFNNSASQVSAKTQFSKNNSWWNTRITFL